MGSKHQMTYFLGIFIFFLLEASWVYAFFLAPNEASQGQVYRILYLHAPAAIVAIGFCSLVMLVISIVGLVKSGEKWLNSGVACAEVGLLFTVLALASGSIWGKPTWGTYWTWDARLTTTFLLAVLFGAYLLLYRAIEPGRSRIKILSILGILICVDTPIIYKSVTWWRTLHQPPSMLRPEGPSTMDAEMQAILWTCTFIMASLAAWMIWTRSQNIALAQEIEELALEKSVPR